MLYWAGPFLVVAIVAAVLGFGELMPATALVARGTFFVFTTLFFASSIAGLSASRRASSSRR